MLRLELGAWVANAKDQRAASLSLMGEAAALEQLTPKHAVTPAPTLPACEQWGDLLMEQRQPAQALAAYQRSMALYPRRFNTLLGAARAADAIDDRSLARAFYRSLLEVAATGTREPALQEARDYLNNAR